MDPVALWSPCAHERVERRGRVQLDHHVPQGQRLAVLALRILQARWRACGTEDADDREKFRGKQDQESRVVRLQLQQHQQSHGLRGGAPEAHTGRRVRWLRPAEMSSLLGGPMLPDAGKGLQILLGFRERALPALHNREVVQERAEVNKKKKSQFYHTYHNNTVVWGKSIVLCCVII